MKATIDIPDDLYRRVKAKSALQGRPVREVVVHLFLGWMGEADDSPSQKAPMVKNEPAPGWFGAARKYARKNQDHDMASIRRSIARGRAREAAVTAKEETA